MSSLGEIRETVPEKCQICGVFAETRPYGPNGEQVCFECGMADLITTEFQANKFLFGE
ncbi:MAG: hypothetical protein Dbin4_02546 [Alphaproteobacteria bacterium]|nr:hypothetical protein [Alphaproteobacteria bacterium]